MRIGVKTLRGLEKTISRFKNRGVNKEMVQCSIIWIIEAKKKLRCKKDFNSFFLEKIREQVNMGIIDPQLISLCFGKRIIFLKKGILGLEIEELLIKCIHTHTTHSTREYLLYVMFRISLAVERNIMLF